MSSQLKLLLISLSVLLLTGVVVASVVWIVSCPCERIPGGYLMGKEAETPISDWSFANSEPLCQIEVGSLVRHSVNLNCMAVDGELYLSCANCEGKRWSTIALETQRGRIRIGSKVYPVSLTHVTDANVLDAAWQARAEKLGRESRPRADGWWSFHLRSLE